MTIKELNELAKECDQDNSLTTFDIFETDNNYDWAIVFGFDADLGRVMGKVAYCPVNSAMQEYDFDWMMPVDKSGNVDDTEIPVDGEDDIRYLIKQSNRFRNEYVGKYVEPTY